MVLMNLALAAESYDEKYAQTDTSDPDSLHALVLWCRENGHHSRANQHIRQIYALDPNHAPTRALQGFVWHEERWVHESRLPPSMRPSQQQDKGIPQPLPPRRSVSGPGPQAQDIDWNLAIPSYPEAEARFRPFVESVIERMKTQDIFTMEGSWTSLIRPQHRNLTVSILAQKLVEGDYTDLWGPSKIIETLYKEGGQDAKAQARRLFPFVLTASAQSRNPDATLAFTYVCGLLQKRDSIPRLIEILDGPDSVVASGARQALSSFMLWPEREIEVQQARDWWARYHDRDQETLISEQLRDPNPWVRLHTVQYVSSDDRWDPRAIPTLIRLMYESDRRVLAETARRLRAIAATDWGLANSANAEARQRIAREVEEWWQEHRRDFVPVHLRGRERSPQQQHDRQLREWIHALGSIDSGEVSAALANLRRRGDDAIPALIDGLGHGDGVVRNRVRDLLREMTGQQFAFEGIRGDNHSRNAAIERWREWAQEAGHVQ
ncbi:MAG: hypothetical protein EA401_14240 [Planctomycetota bacterium]|nr:MAG: hypothetical protein EA401_14240 [Planctomycetota bacterium]